MGTRSLTVFEEDGQEIAVLYAQYDGYPTGHGAVLKAVTPNRVVNGYTMEDIADPYCANGMGCLAARVIGRLKDDTLGGFSLMPAGMRGVGEEFRYHIYLPNNADTGVPHLRVVLVGWAENPDRVLYEGPITEFGPNSCYENAHELEV